MSLRQFTNKLFKLKPIDKSLFKSSAVTNGPVRYASEVKAAVLEEFKKPLDLEEIKIPSKLKSGQLKLKVFSCAINPTDVLLTEGENPSGFKLPIVPGYEVCGQVLEAKDCENFAKGDKVVALNKESLGGFAQQCVVNEKDTWMLPAGLAYDEGAALVDSFGTALLGLVSRGKLNEKQTVLVTMAPGHGYAPLDLAANVYKAKVIAVCSSENEADSLRGRGAWKALSFNDKQLKAAVKDVSKGGGVHLVYDTFAGDVLNSALQCVSHDGHVIVAGHTLEELPHVPIAKLLALPSFSLSAVSLRNYRLFAFDQYRQAVQDVLDMKEQNLISPFIAASFPLKDVNKAIQYIKESKPAGKVLLNLQDDD